VGGGYFLPHPICTCLKHFVVVAESNLVSEAADGVVEKRARLGEILIGSYITLRCHAIK
jgi:hypothetical protein